MANIYIPDELNNFSKESLVAMILTMREQLGKMSTNMECLIDQIAATNNQCYSPSQKN